MLFAWLAERRHQLLCPGIELRKQYHAKVVLGACYWSNSAPQDNVVRSLALSFAAGDNRVYKERK